MELKSFENDKLSWGEYCHIIIFTYNQRQKFFRTVYVDKFGKIQVYDLILSVRRWLDGMNIEYTTKDYQDNYNKFPEIYLKNKEDFIAFKLVWD